MGVSHRRRLKLFNAAVEQRNETYAELHSAEEVIKYVKLAGGRGGCDECDPTFPCFDGTKMCIRA